MRSFSTSWKGSKRPGKQRKFRFMAPLHVRRKLMRVHLSKDLRQKFKIRNISIRTGDTIKILKGDFSKSEGKVERVDAKNYKVYVTGIDRSKKDGTKALVPLAPASLIIIDLNTDDKRRLAQEPAEKKAKEKKTEKAPTKK